jgi:CheY-like chemotaxis protein
MAELNRILHVDDDQDILDLARMSLEIVGGFEVHQCRSASQATDEISRINPDLLLLDVMMPDTDGPQLLREVRCIPGFQDICAIFMTAKAESDAASQLRSTGALGIVTKPFDPMQLPTLLRRMWAKEDCPTDVSPAT